MKKMSIISTFILWIYVGVVMFLILYDFSNIEMQIPKGWYFISADMIAHFGMFLVFTLILSLYSIHHPNITCLQHSYMILFIGVTFAFITEGAQLLTTYRKCDIMDIFSDVYGIITGLLIVKISRKKDKKSTEDDNKQCDFSKMDIK